MRANEGTRERRKGRRNSLKEECKLGEGEREKEQRRERGKG